MNSPVILVWIDSRAPSSPVPAISSKLILYGSDQHCSDSDARLQYPS